MAQGKDGRVPMLSATEAGEAARAAGIPEDMAGLSVFRILLRHPALAKELAGTLRMLLFDGNRLDARLRELIILRIGWVTGAVYEWTQHWRLSIQLKIPERDLLAVRDWRNAAHLSEADRAVLAATDETLAQGRISDATWAACARHLASAEERLELVAAIGNWTLFSQLLKNLEVPLEEGVAPWPPDGQSPPAAAQAGG